MANKQTAGLQLIDLKGIDLLNGPVKIKGVYQQVIANKFIKTITNLVYNGYAYDDFPITLTTTDGLTYTGEYIDTVSSKMLQWLSITINNQSEVTVTKELFQGGGGGGGDVGYEEMTFEEFKANPDSLALFVYEAPSDLIIRVSSYTFINDTIKYSLINEVVKDANGFVTNISYTIADSPYFKTKSLTNFQTQTRKVLFKDTQYIFEVSGPRRKTQAGSDNKQICTFFAKLFNSTYFDIASINYSIGQNKFYLGTTGTWTDPDQVMRSGSAALDNRYVKLYKDKAFSKLLQSI